MVVEERCVTTSQVLAPFLVAEPFPKSLQSHLEMQVPRLAEPRLPHPVPRTPLVRRCPMTVMVQPVGRAKHLHKPFARVRQRFPNGPILKRQQKEEVQLSDHVFKTLRIRLTDEQSLVIELLPPVAATAERMTKRHHQPHWEAHLQFLAHPPRSIVTV